MQKLKSALATPVAALAILLAPVVTTTQVAVVAVPVAVATATMLPASAHAGLVLSEVVAPPPLPWYASLWLTATAWF